MREFIRLHITAEGQTEEQGSSCRENHDSCLRTLFLRLRQPPLEYRMLNVEY